MKIQQEYTSDESKLIPSALKPLQRIEKLPLPYTGNKKKLIYQIHDAIIEHKLEFNSVLDAFSGSATVSLLFKLMGKTVLANDLLTSSYLNAVSFVENPGIKLTKEEKKFLLYHENPNKNTFVEDNYLGAQYRKEGQTCRFNKFTLKECQHLDNFRANIDELCDLYKQSTGLIANAAVVMRLPFGQADMSNDILKHRIKQETNYGKNSDKHDRRIGIYYDDEQNLNFNKWFIKYVNDFMNGIDDTANIEAKIKRATFLVNLQQHVLRDCMVQGRFHQGQSLAELNIRLGHQKNQLKGHWSNNGKTEMDFFTEAGASLSDQSPGQGMRWWTFVDIDMPGKCLAVNMDIIELLKSGFCNVDAIYFDPPYGSSASDYPTIYRFFEEYIYSKKLEELPHIQDHAHRFCKKRNYEEHFREMLSVAKHVPLWLFSFNDTSWKGIDYIVNIIKEYKTDVISHVLDAEYRYLYRKKQGRTETAREFLIIAR